MKDNQIVIIGLHFGHDASVAVLIDGNPVCNLIRERHNRSKHSFGMNVSHIEKALLDANLTVEDIDMIAITSTQCFELVVVDRPNELQLEYGKDSNKLIPSTMYDKHFNEEDTRFQKLLDGNIIDQIYSDPDNNPFYKNLFPEYKYIKKEKLGITKSLRDFPELEFWKKELGLKDFSGINFSNLLKNKEHLIDLFHFPMRITLKGRNIPGVAIQHHMAHAASAFYNCKTDKSIIFTHDGGFYETGCLNGMIFYGEGNKIIPLFPHHLCIGRLYEQVGLQLGFDQLGAAGKLMGLAPYGKPVFFNSDLIGNTYDLRRKGIKNPGLSWLQNCLRLAQSKGYDLNPLGNSNRVLEPICVDLASSTQKLFEETLLFATKCFSDMCISSKLNLDSLCYAGGTGLNCPANSLLLKESPFSEIYIPPNTDDSGLSLGGAQYVSHHILNNPRLPISKKSYLSLPYLGLINSENDLQNAIKQFEDQINVQEIFDSEKIAAKDLNENKIIAWFEGRSEIGPRALGHRSLLINPKYSENWERMNTLKEREKWRPFAPAVLEEDIHLYFKGIPNESPFMLFTAEVLTNDLPAITHVDGSARVQTVTSETGGLFLILKNLKEISGCSVVLNTSFNGPKEPIIEKPEEAITFLLNTELDVLYLEGKRLTRKTID